MKVSRLEALALSKILYQLGLNRRGDLMNDTLVDLSNRIDAWLLDASNGVSCSYALSPNKTDVVRFVAGIEDLAEDEGEKSQPDVDYPKKRSHRHHRKQ